jgi:hypothetical protein
MQRILRFSYVKIILFSNDNIPVRNYDISTFMYVRLDIYVIRAITSVSEGPELATSLQWIISIFL